MGSAPELIVIGLACILVGLFLLANSIVFRSPRHLIVEFFGVGQGTLRPLRDYILNKIQVVIGFLFLTAGLVLQLWSFWNQIDNKVPTLIVTGVLVCFATGVWLVGNVYSRRSFQRYLSEFFAQHDFNFHQNIELTKQMGKAFGIPSSPEESVEQYVAKVMRALGLDPRGTKANEQSVARQRLREMAPPMPSIDVQAPEARYPVAK